MGLSCFGAISGIGLDGLDGWDLCAGLLYEHRFAMLIKRVSNMKAFSSCFFSRQLSFASLFAIFKRPKIFFDVYFQFFIKREIAPLATRPRQQN